MLKLSLNIGSSEEARRALLRVKEALSQSELSAASRASIEGALYPTLELWADQLANPATKSFKADRFFSGDDYTIAVRARRGTSPISAIFDKLMGRG